MVGEPGVGKTALVRWMAQSPFEPAYRPTVGVEHTDITLTLEAHAWKLQLWDWAGAPHHHELTYALQNWPETHYVYDGQPLPAEPCNMTISWVRVCWEWPNN